MNIDAYNAERLIGNTPLVALQRMDTGDSEVLAKLEGDNPAGSVKDRPAFYMIKRAEERGTIRKGDTLIEATSGNTGIALAMVAAMRGYRLKLIMPETMSLERRACMKAYGAEIILVTEQESMEGARDLAAEMASQGEGYLLNQFANPDNPAAHYETTGPEIWRDTHGEITHFVSSMGTTGTIMGVSHYLKERNPAIEIIGVQPAEGTRIPGIRRWPKAYLPKIFDASRVDREIDVTQEDAENTMREMASREGIFCGPSSGGCAWVALQMARELKGALLVSIVCDRGDRYISSGIFPS